MTGRSDILIGDCRAQLATLPAASVHCAVTSPPYWGLRDYGVDGQLGLEPTPAAFVAGMVEVFRAVWRVLRDDGVCWINIGDTYNQDSKWGGSSGNKNELKQGYARKKSRDRDSGCKATDLIGVPWLLAAALKADGWYLRCDVIWAKRSPMPESVNGVRWEQCRVKVRSNSDFDTGKNGEHIDRRKVGFNERYDNPEGEHVADYVPCPGCDKCRDSDGFILRRGSWRPTRSHEYVFMLTKEARYFCDASAVQEASAGTAHPRGQKMNSPKEAANHAAGNGHGGWHGYTPDLVETRNPRSVWLLSSEPTKLKHFATFPSKLIIPAIKASTSSAGCCPSCGACYAPVVESERVPTRPGINNKIWKHADGDSFGQRSDSSPNLDPQRHIKRTTVSGYRPTCGCNAGESVPCTVLDPFSGAGTTGCVCKWLNLNYVGIELNPEYAAMSIERIANSEPPAVKKPKRKKVKRSERQASLFD